MKKIIGIIIAVLVVVFLIWWINIDVTEEGALPDVDVNVEGGEMPEVEAETGSVDVGTETQEVEVPTVDINPPEDDDNN